MPSGFLSDTSARKAAASATVVGRFFFAPLATVPFLLPGDRRKEDEMTEFHGKLLIGGMTLKNLIALIDEETRGQDGIWHGALSVDLCQGEHLECGRLYRLELEDGRAAKVIITRLARPEGQQSLQIEFDGLSSLECGRAVWEWDEPVEANC